LVRQRGGAPGGVVVDRQVLVGSRATNLEVDARGLLARHEVVTRLAARSIRFAARAVREEAFANHVLGASLRHRREPRIDCHSR
jgi:hypothetical protein